MSQISIIIFREILEISIIISIIAAATKELKNRTHYINIGLIAGVIGSILIATIADNIANAFDGIGHEIINGIILIIASLMIGYTVIWMKTHAKTISKDLKDLGQSVLEGEKPLYSIAIIVALSVLREGSEIVLFSYSYYIAGTSIYELIAGGLVGLLCGAIAGFALYFGLLKTLGKYFFKVTTIILIFLSAGLMSSAMGYLAKAKILPIIITGQLWDSSNIIPRGQFIGEALHMLIGYVEQPSLIQLIMYLLVIIILFILSNNNAKSNS